MEIPAARVEALLDAWPVARLASVTPDARPHVVPVVFARAAGALWSSIDGKPKRSGALQRVANLRAHPDVSLLLDHYDADWQQLWWIRVDAQARVVEASAPEGEIREACDALRRKYPQYAHTPLFRGEPRLLRLAPRRVVSWCADSVV